MAIFCTQTVLAGVWQLGPAMPSSRVEWKDISPPDEKPMSEIIFNQEVTHDLKEKYHEKFGSIDTESFVYQPYFFGMTVEDRLKAEHTETERQKRKDYAEYMLRRTTQWQVDNFLKSDPNIKPVYELKERLSKVEIPTGEETKLKMEYAASGNAFVLNYLNPWCTSKLEMQMDPHSLAPGPVQETRLDLKKDLVRNWKVATYLLQVDGVSTLEFTKKHTRRLLTTYAASTYFKEVGITPRESKISWGIAWIF